MKNLLAVEWLKLKKFRTFWVLVGFFVLLLPSWNLGISKGVINIGSGEISLVSQAYGFANVWQNMGFWTSIFVVFLSLLVIIITTNEYQYRTHRQNVIDGWSRLDFYHAKWQVVLLLSVFTTVYVFFIGLWFGVQYGSISDFPGSVRHLFYTWLLTLNYGAFSLVLSLFLKRSGIAIGMFFLYSMVVESMVSKFINWVFKTELGNFLPLQCSDELLPFPILDALKAMAQLQSDVAPMWYVLASLGWIVAYYFIGRQKLLRSDW